MEEAVDTDRKLIFFSVASCLGVAILMIIVSPFFPQIYNTSDDVKYIAAAILLINYTDWNVILVYFLVQMMEIVKCIIGYVLVKKGVWLNNMTIKAANS